jgi:hypothetical protein
MKMEQTQCSETLAFKLHTPGNNPEESTRRSKHGEILKSRITGLFLRICERTLLRLHLYFEQFTRGRVDEQQLFGG